MIEHLRGRDRKLEPLGWTGRRPDPVRIEVMTELRPRDRVADLEQRRENVPHIEQGDLPGARS